MEENKTLHQQLLEAGVHFGHLKKKWNPKMLPYIFAEKNGIHIIDLNKTIEGLDEAAAALKSIARSGKKIMFVATKKQAKEIMAEAAQKMNMPYVTERWLGGMLTNFATIRKSVKKMLSIEKMLADGTMDSVTKKERLTLTRSKEKMEKVLGGIAQMGRTPSAIFMVDIHHEHIALAEAKRLGITTFAMVDTNSDPSKVDFPIPANDDATKSIAIITNYLTAAILEGLQERAQDKEAEDENATAEEIAERTRGLEITEEDNEGGRGRGRGRGRSAGTPAGAGSGAGRPGGGSGAGRPGGGGGRGPGGGSGRPGGGGGRGPGGGGTRPGGGGGRGPGGGGSRPGGGGGSRPATKS
jgi:small subunit ribosomal protein S2